MSDSANYEADRELALAGAVAARRFGQSHGVDVRHLGQGSNNTAYLAAGRGEQIVVKLSRPHREDGALDEYGKEAWCTAEARKLGVPTPEVFEVGVHDGRAFAMLAFVEGRPPEPSQAPAMWRTLGDYARRINAIAVKGWGPRLLGDGRFAESWQAHVAYNITSLKPDDELIARNVLDASSSRRLREGFEGLLPSGFKFGLCHADLVLPNMLVDEGGTPWLLDWGCAAAAIVPHYEINEVLRSAQPDEQLFAAFLDGYGISSAAYAALGPQLRLLAALREVDLLRWALDKKPDMIATFEVTARKAVAKLE